MKLSRSLSAILSFAAASCCAALNAQPVGRANPLLEMVGCEPVGSYYETYESVCDSLFTGDTLSRVELVRLFAEAAEADPTGAWELDRQRMAGHVRFYESREEGYPPPRRSTPRSSSPGILSTSPVRRGSGGER